MREQGAARWVGKRGKSAIESSVMILNHMVKFRSGYSKCQPLGGIVDREGGAFYGPPAPERLIARAATLSGNDGCFAMKIKNSLRALRKRHRNNRVVRRRGRLYVINKTNRRYKARQG